jgi:hypothetical protein
MDPDGDEFSACQKATTQNPKDRIVTEHRSVNLMP